MKNRYWLVLSAILLFALSNSFGQGIYLESVEGLYGPIDDSTIVADGSTEIVFNMRLAGLSQISLGFTAGFRVYSDDGAEWVSTNADTLDVGTSWDVMWDSSGGFFKNYFGVTGSGADTVGLGALAILNGLPADFDAVAFEVRIGPISSEHGGKTICLDSCFYPPAGYWILAGSGGAFEWSGPHRFILVNPTDAKEFDNGLPSQFSLGQNYPNPFNPSTEILFDLPNRSHVRLSIYNVMGQKVRTLVDEELPAGSYRRSWDGTNEHGENVSSGIYLYRMNSGTFVQGKKMILLK